MKFCLQCKKNKHGITCIKTISKDSLVIVSGKNQLEHYWHMFEKPISVVDDTLKSCKDSLIEYHT